MMGQTNIELRRCERAAMKELNASTEAQREIDREANAKELVRSQISHYFAYLWTRSPRSHQRDLSVAFDIAYEIHGIRWHQFEGTITLSKIVSDLILCENPSPALQIYTHRLRTLGSAAAAHWVFRTKLLKACNKLGLEETIVL